MRADDQVLRALEEWLLHLGHMQVIIQTDDESSIIASMRMVIDQVAGQLATAEGHPMKRISMRTTQGYSSGSNGGVERFIGTVKGLFRTYNTHVAQKLSEPAMTVGMPICDWSLHHAVWVYNHVCVAQVDKRTPYQRLRGKLYTTKVFEFASPIMFATNNPSTVCGSTSTWWASGHLEFGSVEGWSATQISFFTTKTTNGALERRAT